MVRAWAACFLNFVPLLWLIVLAARQQSRDVAFLWIATSFALGGVADVLAALGLGWAVAGHVYPLGQSALIAAVLLDKPTALWFLGLLGWVAVGSLLIWPTAPDVPLHVCAWVSLGWVANRVRPIGPLWFAIFCGFGLALPCYLWFVATRSLDAWVAMQAAYAVGVGFFCYAASRTRTALAVV